MIVHLVLLKVRADVPAARVAEVFAEIGALREEIAGIVDYAWGPYSSPEGLNRGFTHGFSMTFTDAAHRDLYLPHPAHEVVKAHVVAILAGGVDGALAFDFEA
jgi:hypothetical protein